MGEDHNATPRGLTDKWPYNPPNNPNPSGDITKAEILNPRPNLVARWAFWVVYHVRVGVDLSNRTLNYIGLIFRW